MNKMSRLPHFNTVSKDKLRIILNLSCESHVINDVMKYVNNVKNNLYYSLLDITLMGIVNDMIRGTTCTKICL